MKKIMWVIILGIIGITTSVFAGVNDTKVRVEYFNDTYANFVIGDLFYWHQVGIPYMNGRVGFCLEPGVWLTEYTYSSYTDFGIKGISAAKKHEFALYAHYGYEYPNHATKKYYLATQELIWRGLGLKTVYWSTGAEHTGETINVEKEKQEILKLVAAHEKKPSFHNQTFEVKKGQVLTITDKNKLLNRYQIIQSGGNSLEKKGNDLIVTSKKNGNTKIELQYVASNKTSILYVKDNSQTLASLGLNDKVKASFSLNTKAFRLSLYKKDLDHLNNIPRGEATLEGAIYGIFKDGVKIEEATTDQDGKLIFQNLELGDYLVKEIKASEGYELDLKEYPIKIKEDTELELTKEVYEKVIENEIEIMKVYTENGAGILPAEKQIQFSIYDHNNQRVKTLTTDDKGMIKCTLPYGTYKVVQDTTTPGYDKVKDFLITVSEKKTEPIRYVLSDILSSAKIKIIKVDEEGNNIKKAGISFKIKNMDTNEYVKQTITYPEEKTIDIFETDKNGVVILPQVLSSGTYELEEVKGPDGYLPLSSNISFVIDENTPFLEDGKDHILEIRVENKRPKGKIEIVKTGSETKLEKRGSYYEEVGIQKELSGVIFDVIADEDILINGTVIYKKGEVADTVTTKDGYAVTKELPLGNYCMKETRTLENYILDETPYCVRLTWNQKSDVVLEQMHLNNKKRETKVEIEKIGEKMIGIQKETGEYTEEHLSNITFYLENITPITIDDKFIEIGKMKMTGKTNSEGKLVFEGLPFGKYKLYEEEKEGYQNLKEIVFEIKEGQEVITKKILNQKVKGNIMITKVDSSTSKKIGGMKLKLIHKESGFSFSKTMNETGILNLYDLEYGTYEVLEIEAPKGYIKTNERYHFKIDGTKKYDTLNITNERLKLPDTSSIKRQVLTVGGIIGGFSFLCFVISYFLKRHSYD